jgi:hypothetical protein
MTPGLWMALGATILAFVAIWLLLAIDARRGRHQHASHKTVPKDLPPEGRWH